jgi:S1-C subfamily serine protease
MAAGTDWFEEVRGADISPGAMAGDSSLGLRLEVVELRTRRALKVVEVQADSPAGEAGLEVGDVLVEANGRALTRVDQWAAAVRNGNGKIRLLVRDVRSGRDLPVEVSWELAMDPSDGGQSIDVGVVSELAFYRGQPALKVTGVKENSPAAAAGLETGWLIVTAGGDAVSDSGQLQAAVRAAVRAERESLELEVVEPRSGQTRTLRLRLR